MVKLPEKEEWLEITLGSKNESRGHLQEHPNQEYYQYWEDNEELGELPPSYAEDGVVLLTLHCTAAYVYWDFSPLTLQKAFDWMPKASTKVRLWQGDQVVQELDCSLTDNCQYFHGLSANQTYRAEVIADAQDGQIRRIGPLSNPAHTPASSPSSNRDDRFVRAFMSMPNQQLTEFIPPEQIPVSPPDNRRKPFWNLLDEPSRLEPARRNQPGSDVCAPIWREAIPSTWQSELYLASNVHSHDSDFSSLIEHLVTGLEMCPFPEEYRQRLFFPTCCFYQNSPTSSEQKPQEYSLTEENN